MAAGLVFFVGVGWCRILQRCRNVLQRFATFDITTGTMGLSAEQWRYISFRLVTNTDAEAIRQSGCKERTVYEWMAKDPEFSRELDAAAQDGVHVAQEILRQHLGQAALTLVAGLTAQGATVWPSRIRAAELILRAKRVLVDSTEVAGPGGGRIQTEGTVNWDAIPVDVARGFLDALRASRRARSAGEPERS